MSAYTSPAIPVHARYGRIRAAGGEVHATAAAARARCAARRRCRRREEAGREPPEPRAAGQDPQVHRRRWRRPASCRASRAWLPQRPARGRGPDERLGAWKGTTVWTWPAQDNAKWLKNQRSMLLERDVRDTVGRAFRLSCLFACEAVSMDTADGRDCVQVSHSRVARTRVERRHSVTAVTARKGLALSVPDGRAICNMARRNPISSAG